MKVFNTLISKYILIGGIIIAHALFPQSAFAQKPENVAVPQVTARPLPGSYPSNVKVNLIREYRPNKPLADQGTVESNTDPNVVNQRTVYFDGMGRQIQIVVKQHSPLLKDIVAPCIYDDFGREAFQYQPYVAQNGNTNDGKFKLKPLFGSTGIL